jgi:hypothetical protein
MGRTSAFSILCPGNTMIDVNNLIGKTIIIGITRLDANDELIEQIQINGVFSQATSKGIMIRLSTGDDYKLPPDYGSIKKALSGEYRFRTTGETVMDPDYMTTWTIHEPKEQPTEEQRDGN